ncbi:hypothetical protein ACO0K9_15995 [Undibacterium sp. Ji50W]|uniref:hypothetical protein n=1 Tax=Undibacterium sp. Ji50W TaxID=3413041 RepID=UPI003BEFE8EA
MIKNRFPILALFLILVLTFFVYQPGLSGYFMFDDSVNILENDKLRITSLNWLGLKQAAFSGTAGALGRPISMLSFALDYLVAENNPAQFKLTNLIIHLLNGICVFFFSTLLLKAHRTKFTSSIPLENAGWVSVCIAAAWLLHPLNLSGVLYVVQRMTSLSSLFCLLGLIFYVHGRLQMASNSKGWLYIFAAFFICTPLAIFSKENGALLPFFFFLTECIFFGFNAPILSRKLLKTIYVCTLAIPLLGIAIFLALHPEWLSNTYKIRDFTLAERMLTEARIIWFYIRLVFVPDINVLGLFHDDISLSKDWLEPITTLPACLGILGLGIAGLVGYKRVPIAAYGILFFLVGHSLESSFIPLELIHEHRNYLPSFGLIFALMFYLFVPGKHNESMKIRSLLAIFILIMLGSISYLRAAQWGNAVEMKLKEVAHHPESNRANMDIAAFYAAMPATNQEEADDYYKQAYQFYAKAAELSASDTLGLMGLISLNANRTMPVEDVWVSALTQRLTKFPFATNTGNSLSRLSQCAIAKNCEGIDITVGQLFEAALKNPTLTGKTKTQLLFAWSDYLLRIRQDPTAALRAARDAAASAPNDIDAQMNTAIMLVNLKLNEEAKKQITVVRQLDHLQTHTSSLAELEKLIK